MAGCDLPIEIQTFVVDHLDSIEQVEVLLLLRERRERAWTPSELSRELRSAPESVAKRLRGLLDKKLVTLYSEKGPGGELLYSYQPPSEKADHLVGELAEQYRTRRFSVINLILSKPADAIRTFADAFKIKKDNKRDEDG
jgi:hypothetical protein